MNSTPPVLSWLRLPGARTPRVAFALALVAAGVALPTSVAFADDDGAGSMLGSIVSTVMGAGPKSDVDLPIEYRARPPLVLPPKAELVPPSKSAASRNPAWPKDPDVEAAKKAKALERAPVTGATDLTAKLSPDELRQGRINPADQAPPSVTACDSSSSRGCNGDSSQMWTALKTAKTEDDSKTITLQPGQEPPREYLTQPPRGYLAPKKTVKYTFDSPSKNLEAPSVDDAAAYTREQSRRKTTVDD